MKDRLVYWLFRAAAGAFGLLPEAAMRATGRGLGVLWYRLSPGRRRMAERHMRRGGVDDPKAAARDVFAWYGRYWAETFWMRPHRLSYVLDNAVEEHLERFHASRDSGRGTIFALAHLGNWEAAGARSTAEGTRVLAVAEALANRLIVDWFVRVRNEMHIDVVIAEKGSSVTKTLIKRLREGGAIALLCDRDLTGKGVPVKFFGEVTTLPAGPVALADRTGADLMPLGAYFHDGPGHLFRVFEPIPIPAADTAEERVAAGTQLLAEALEEMIRHAPTQWHLLQPNWPSDREAV